MSDQDHDNISQENTAWNFYIETRYGINVSDRALTCFADAATSALTRQKPSVTLVPLSTRDLLLPLSKEGAPFEGLKLKDSGDTSLRGASGNEPVYIPENDLDDRIKSLRREALGTLEASSPFETVIEEASALARSIPNNSILSEWQLGLALLKLEPAGFIWSLESRGTTLLSATKTFSNNLKRREPNLFSQYRKQIPNAKKQRNQSSSNQKKDSNQKSQKSAPPPPATSNDIERRLLEFELKSDLQFSEGLRDILTAAYHIPEESSGVIAGITTPRIIFAALQSGRSDPDQNQFLAHFYKNAGESTLIQMHRFLEHTLSGREYEEFIGQEFPLLSTDASLVLRSAQRSLPNQNDRIEIEDVLVTIYQKRPPDCKMLVAEGSDFRTHFSSWLFAANESSPLPEYLYKRLKKPDQPIGETPNTTETLQEPSPPTTGTKDNLEDTPKNSIAKRGPDSPVASHPLGSEKFRILNETERQAFESFRKKENLNLSYACWNSHVIAWEDTAAFGDSGGDPIVTALSVYIGFLDTGLAALNNSEENSLAAAFVPASEIDEARRDRLRIQTNQAKPEKSNESELRGDDSLRQLWKHAARIKNQCTDDEYIAARHLLASFIWLHFNDVEIREQLAYAEFNHKIALLTLKEHLAHYETSTHADWRRFFQSLGHDDTSPEIQDGYDGITPTRFNALCLGIDQTSEAIAKVFRSAKAPQKRNDPLPNQLGKVSDFVFALYGPWGRGKSTLMRKVSSLLEEEIDTKDSDDQDKLKEQEKEKSKEQEKDKDKDKDKDKEQGPFRRFLLRIIAWLAGVFWGYPSVRRSYATIEFSAWKYPSRPEIWIHLYERIKEAAECDSLLQRLRLSFRQGILETGWLPLISGFVLLAIARLPLTDWVGGILSAVGWLGVLLIAGFLLRTSKIGSIFASRYTKIPSHAEKLGLQAVIGRDLKNLLKVWINPPNDPSSETDLSSINFLKYKKGWWMTLFVAFLIGFSTWQLMTSIHEAHIAQLAAKEKAEAIEKERQEQENSKTVQTTIRVPVGELQFDFPISSTNETKEIPQKEVADPFWIYTLILGLAGSSFIFGWIITRPPKQNETLLLIVDDLDRCEPDQMLAVIDSLRLFLDDQEMSRRLQMAILLDKELVEESLKSKFKKKGTKYNEERLRQLYRTHREKVFLCEFSMPPLQDHEREDLLKSLFPEDSSDNSTPSKKPPETPPLPIENSPEEAGKALEESKKTESKKGLEPTPDAREAKRLKDIPTKQQETEAPAEALETAPPTDEPEPGPEKKLTIDDQASDEGHIFTIGDTDALRDAISKIPAHQLTPRSLLMLKVRYELVRLLLKHQLDMPEPDDKTLSGIADHLIRDLYPSESRYLACIPLEVKAVISQVTTSLHVAE